jgi:hypothetical protein
MGTLPALRPRKDSSPAKLLNELRDLIQSTRSWVAQAVNTALVLLYWQVGNRIRTERLKSERATYGAQIVVTLSRQLAAELGNGYSRPNLFRMIRFAEVISEREIVSTLSTQLSWSHFVEVLQRKTSLQRNYDDLKQTPGSHADRSWRRSSVETRAMAVLVHEDVESLGPYARGIA